MAGVSKSRIRAFARLAIGAYPACLTGWLLLLRFLEPKYPVLAAFHYLPFQLWLFPMLFFIPMAAVLFRPALLLYAFSIWYVLSVYAGLNLGSKEELTGEIVTCMTNNVGQSNKQSFVGFFQAQNPDILLLQDSRGGVREPALSDRFMERAGEFTIFSKYPVKTGSLLTGLRPGHSPVAARFELDVKGRTLVVYNVHLPTPRSQLLSLGAKGIVMAIVDPSAVDARSRKYDFTTSMLERREIIERLKIAVLGEQSPVIVGGDFNAPPQTALHWSLQRTLQDAFLEKGKGFGFTFPGFTRNPLTFFGPWLRLDFLYSRRLQPVYCRIEKGRPSQHLAVVAAFAWSEDSRTVSSARDSGAFGGACVSSCLSLRRCAPQILLSR